MLLWVLMGSGRGFVRGMGGRGVGRMVGRRVLGHDLEALFRE